MTGKKRSIQRRILTLLLAAALCICQGGMIVHAKKRSRNAGTYTVQNPDGSVRTYRKYRQDKNYYNGRYYADGARFNCVVTATAIAASGFGVSMTPQQILDADASNPCGQRYALQKLNFMYHPKQVLTPYLSAQILGNMGIPVRYVPTYSIDHAEQEITSHLASGKPVIIMARDKRWRRIRIAHWRHAIVLVQLKGDGTVTFINPNAGINRTHHGGKCRGVRLTVRQLLEHFMYNSSGDWARAYNPSNCGGYILVG